MGFLLHIKLAACIFSKHIFLRTTLNGCFRYKLYSTLSSCIWKGVSFHVVETKLEAKNFHKIFYDVLERGFGVEHMSWAIFYEQIELRVAPKKKKAFPGVFIKNQRSWFDTFEFLPSNKGRVSTQAGKVRKFVRGSGKIQCRKFLSIQIFNFNKKICTQKCVHLNCIWQSVVYMMLLFASSIKMIKVRTPPPPPPFFRAGK